jgi:hypothetical protein
MSTPVNSEQDPVSPRDERLLHWRFHFADGEMWAFGSSFDARVVAVVRRARRIDAALALCAPQTREVLWRAYGARPDPALARLSPQRFVEAGVLVVQPLLCNLVELAPEAARLHAQSGSTKPLRQWLERLSAKSGAGRGSATAVQAILAGARRLLAAAGAEYADARAGIQAPFPVFHPASPPAPRLTVCWVDCPHALGACLGAQRAHTAARARRDAAQTELRRANLELEEAELARLERAAVRAVVAFLRWGVARERKRRRAA